VLAGDASIVPTVNETVTLPGTCRGDLFVRQANAGDDDGRQGVGGGGLIRAGGHGDDNGKQN